MQQSVAMIRLSPFSAFGRYTLHMKARDLPRCSPRAARLCALLIFLCGCVQPGVEDENATPSNDAFMVISGIVDAALPAGPRESERLFFVAQGQGYLVELATPRPQLVCPLGRPKVSLDGERVLCIPEEEGEPLVLKDLFSEQELAQYGPWKVKGDGGRPLISPDGSLVAYLDDESAGYNEVVLANDLSMELGRRGSLKLWGFLGSSSLLIDYPPRLWEVDRIQRDPREVESYNFILSESPAALLYEEGLEPKQVMRIGAEGGAAERVGRGELQDTYQRWAFTLDWDDEGRNIARVFPFQGDGERQSLPLEQISFDTQPRLRAVNEERALLELQRTDFCDEDVSNYTIKTILINLRTGGSEVLAEGDEAHQVFLSGESETAVIIESDRCGRPTGRGTLKTIGGERRALPAPLNGSIRAAALSGAGGQLALASELQVWLYDLSSGDFQEVYNGGNVSPWLLFR